MRSYRPSDNDRTLMARNLSFNRSIAPSPSLLTAFDSARPDHLPQPIILQKVKVRGAFLNSYLKGDKADPNFDPSKPNIMEGDIANLPPDCDSFRMDFSVNVTAGSVKPNTCELPKLDRLIHEISEAYARKHGYHLLAERYVWRLVNGSMMWRNYTVSSNKRVIITFGDEHHTVAAQCRNLSRTKFPGRAELRDMVPGIDPLVDGFAHALSNDGDPFILQVTAMGLVGYGGEIYPSQVFSSESRNTAASSEAPGATRKAANRTSRELVAYELSDGRRQAKMNATKIGNAIRHIDEWHGDEEMPATSIEAYGFVQQNLSALRPIKGPNFYNLLWQDSKSYPDVIAKAANAAAIPGDVHYFMAMLIRGGVFVAPGGE